MTARLLVALSTTLEQRFVTTVQAARHAEVARRCPDVADLLAAAAAGVGDGAAVSPDLPHLDQDVIDQLHRAGVGIIGVVAVHDEAGERRLRQLGVERIVSADATEREIDAAVVELLPTPGAVVRDRAGAPHDPLDPTLGADLDRRLDAALAGDVSGLGTNHAGMDADSSAQEPDEDRAPGRVIAVWGPIGSPGRTTTAITLAAEFAAAGVPTLLIDADTYAASVAQSLGLLDDTPGLAAAVRAAEQGTLDAPGLHRRAPQVSPGLSVLTGLPRADRWPEIRDGAMARVLELARLIADVVIVDCGFSLEADEELSYDTSAPRRNTTTLVTLEHADELLAVGTADPIGLQRLVRALGDLAHVPSPPPQVVITKVRASAAGPRPERAIREVLSRFSGVEDPLLVPDDRDACDASMLAGRTLVEHAPTSPARVAIAGLARRLLPDRVPPAGSRRSRRRRR